LEFTQLLKLPWFPILEKYCNLLPLIFKNFDWHNFSFTAASTTSNLKHKKDHTQNNNWNGKNVDKAHFSVLQGFQDMNLYKK